MEGVWSFSYMFLITSMYWWSETFVSAKVFFSISECHCLNDCFSICPYQFLSVFLGMAASILLCSAQCKRNTRPTGTSLSLSCSFFECVFSYCVFLHIWMSLLGLCKKKTTIFRLIVFFFFLNVVVSLLILKCHKSIFLFPQTLNIKSDCINLITKLH